MSLINSDVIPVGATGGSAEVNYSLRFNDDDSAYLSRTPTSSGSQRKLTWSGWVKRGNTGSSLRRGLFGSGNQTASNYGFQLTMFNDYLDWHTAGATYRLQSSAILRDPSAWYHIVLAIDTTQATSSNRQKLYVNGVQVTDFGIESYVPQNTDLQVNTSSYTMVVGAGRDGNTTTYYFDGYLAEVNYIDGQQLDPTYFGETGTYGEWKPIEYTGSYGTNGFYLDFDGTYYNDKSGNGNNFTATNLATTDVVVDSPTNNFCTWNPLGSNSGTFYEGNLYWLSSNSGQHTTAGNFAPTSGKWYWEVKSGTNYNYVGVAREDYPGSTNAVAWDDSVGYYGNTGNKYVDNVDSAYGATYTAGDIIGVALNLDGGTVTFYKNNTSQGSISLPSTKGYMPYLGNGTSTGTIGAWANFGQDSSFAGTKTAQGNTDDNNIGDFYYTPPSGYLALCTANLPDPAVIPSEHFNTVLYTGNGTTDHSITGIGFQPDWTWLKSRNSTHGHMLYDSVRGATLKLNSHQTDAETTRTEGLKSFDADGFTVGNLAAENGSSNNFVSWNWKANGSGSSNTDGSITSTVSANQDAGFSIVSYTGNGSSSATTGHGLSQRPDMVIYKSRSSAYYWMTYHESFGNNDYIYLNDTGAKGNHASVGSIPTSTVLNLGDNTDKNASSGSYIAYCFHSVDGFSKVGSYTGNGSTDGTFVYTGFRPAYVMVKRTDTLNGWFIKDIQRGTYSTGTELAAHHAGAEGTHDTNYVLDFVSNGFKFRNSGGGYNGSGGTYIYIAFAEHPFKYTNAR